jgi:hypothetical protein
MRAIIVVAVIVNTCLIGPLYAQMPAEQTYFCIAEMAGGLSYSTTEKRWRGATFKANEKFVLKLKLNRTRVQKDFLGKDETVGDYSVTVTESGKNVSQPCYGKRAPHPKEVTLDEYMIVNCSHNLTDYRFNLKTNRFMGVYFIGYVDGADNNENTPAITGGTCTRIN